MHVQVERRAGYRAMALGLSIPELGMAAEPGGDLGVVIVCRDGESQSCVAAVLDTYSNTAAPLEHAVHAVLNAARRSAGQAGMPEPKRWYLIDVHGYVTAVDRQGRAQPPVVVQEWPGMGVEAMTRHHALAPVLWLELVRFAELALDAAEDPTPVRTMARARKLAARRREIEAAERVTRMLPSVGLGATIVEQQALVGATIVGVSHDMQVVAVKRDLLLDRHHPAGQLHVGNYVPSCYSQTEVYMRAEDGHYRKHGAEDSATLLAGTRMYAPARWRLE